MTTDEQLVDTVAAAACNADTDGMERLFGLHEDDKHHYRQIATAAIAAIRERHAIVELPAPDAVEYDLDSPTSYAFSGGLLQGWYACGGLVYTGEHELTPEQAHAEAAALLAAAAQAEADRG